MNGTPPSKVRLRNARGFTLIEVAIAVGILAVALIALLGLLPGGMTNFRKAMDTSITAQIAQRIMHDMEQAEFSEVIDLTHLPTDATSYCPPHYSFRAPLVKAPAFRYFDEQGEEVIPKTTKLSDDERKAVVYYVNIRIIPRAELPTLNETGSQVAQVTIQVARNPGHQDITPLPPPDPSDPNVPDRNLIQKTARVTVTTYYTLLGKNQGK